MTRTHSFRRSPGAARRAFSLLELMIAIGVLGLGLIMIAAIFPAALFQHRGSVDQARANELFTKAESILRSRLDPAQLWFDPSLLGPPAGIAPFAGRDSPFYLLPHSNLQSGATGWDTLPVALPGIYTSLRRTYANAINWPRRGSGNNGRVETFDVDDNLPAFGGLDCLSDRIAPFTNNDRGDDAANSAQGLLDPPSPFTDGEFMVAPQRYAWYGFYRRMATGTINYAVAVCKQQRNQQFAQQIVNNPPGPVLASRAAPVARRLPVPWRVTCVYDPATRRISNDTSNNAEGLGELAPPGARMMIAGGVFWQQVPATPAITPMTLPIMPAGRVLTVVNVFDNTADGRHNPETVAVLEDISDLPVQYVTPPPAGTPAYRFLFDVWVFPPEVVAAPGGGDPTYRFGKTAPILDWKVFQ